MTRLSKAAAILAAMLTILNSQFAWAEIATREEFAAQCLEAWNRLPNLAKSAGRVATRSLLATQDIYNPFKMAKGSSNTESIDVITWRDHHFILDGHHRALAAVLDGETTVSVNETADLSHLSWLDFVSTMYEMGFMMYLRDGASFLTLCGLLPEPNLQLARIVTERITIDPSARTMHVARRAKHRLITKVGSGKPHQEVRVAKIAKSEGIEYQPSWETLGVPDDVIQTLARALTQDPFFQNDARIIVHDCTQRLSATWGESHSLGVFVPSVSAHGLN